MNRPIVTPRLAGARLRIARIAVGLSVDDVANRSELTPEDILSIENGEVENLKQDQRFNRVLTTLNLDSGYILGDRGIG